MSNGIRWTEQELAAYCARHNRVAVSPANMEPDFDNAAKTADAGQEVDQRVRIHFHSKRRRAIDPDGLYSKAVVDGLRQGGLLVDDSAHYVEAVSYSQEKSAIEETIITVELVRVAKGGRSNPEQFR